MLAILLAVAVLAPLSANAQERMSDARYIAASRCIAYADLPQLQSDPLDITALRTAASTGYRSQSVASDAQENARRVRVTANGLANSERGVDELRQRRDEACASFVELGLVQHGAARSS
jgi:hypothetical protein